VASLVVAEVGSSTSVEQRQSSYRRLCREQLRIGVMQIAKLYTAHPASRRILIGSLDGIVSHLLSFFAGTSQCTAATTSSPQSAAASIAEKCLEVRYFVGGSHDLALVKLACDLVG
jgi:hypothetical protein